MHTIIEKAQSVIREEYEALQQLVGLVDHSFARAVTAIHESKGRVAITGIGKSAIIAQKISATLNSTGTPAIYMHAADAIHGDLGMILEDDVVIVISKSGESPEIKALVPLIQNFGNPIIGLCGNVGSFLAQHSDYIINATVDKEACPNNLAPTTSTTAQMVMGDALAMCLLALKGFSAKDFAKFHPGGALGKRLYLVVADLLDNNEKPKVALDADLKAVIVEISSKRLGATAVVDGDDVLVGIITDGDLRRMLETDTDVRTTKAKDIMTAAPQSIASDALAVNALRLMRKHNITQLPAISDDRYVGMVHLHDLIKEGII